MNRQGGRPSDTYDRGENGAIFSETAVGWFDLADRENGGERQLDAATLETETDFGDAAHVWRIRSTRNFGSVSDRPQLSEPPRELVRDGVMG